MIARREENPARERRQGLQSQFILAFPAVLRYVSRHEEEAVVAPFERKLPADCVEKMSGPSIPGNALSKMKVADMEYLDHTISFPVSRD